MEATLGLSMVVAMASVCMVIARMTADQRPPHSRTGVGSFVFLVMVAAMGALATVAALLTSGNAIAFLTGVSVACVILWRYFIKPAENAHAD